MREAIITVQIDASVSVIAAEPLATPAIISILAFHDMISRLKECLLNVKDAIDIENRHKVQSHVFKQIDIVLIVVQDSMKELKDNVERHLD